MMLTLTKLQELLNYDKETGLFTRKVRTANAIRVGDIAGGLGVNGYIYISLLNKRWLAHRLAWLYVYGEFPKTHLDHIDGNPANNSIGNLRETNQSYNSANTKTRNNVSGAKGVSRMLPAGNRGIWRARITVNYKEKTIGYFHTVAEAKSAYDKAAREAFGEFHRS